MSLGIIGGLGPMATAYFMELLIKMTDADCDQEHLEMIIYNSPEIPDRTKYILKESENNPLPYILQLGKRLSGQNVSAIAIPCITAHYFHQEIQNEVKVPVIHAIRETARLLSVEGIECVGIMATDGTISSEIFQNELKNFGMQVLLPDTEDQKEIMEIIYDQIKAGKEPNLRQFEQIKMNLCNRGAQVVVLGCTELSVIKRDYDLGRGILDALDVLAKCSIISCGKYVKREYENLFTKI